MQSCCRCWYVDMIWYGLLSPSVDGCPFPSPAPSAPPPHPIGEWGSAPTRKMLTSWFLSLLISYTKCSPQWGAVLPSPLRWLWESLMHIFREMGFNSCQFLPRTIVFPLHKGECLSPLLNACFFVPSCKCHLSLNTLPQLVLRICLGY